MTITKFSTWQLFIIVTIFLALSSNVAADSSTKPIKNFSFNGVGTHSCGIYIEKSKGFRAEDFRVLYQQWGAGFLAGASNEGQGSNPHTDLETYTAWLDKWCADDPSSSVVAGVIALGKKLSDR